MENKKTKVLAIDDNQDNLISIKALIAESFPDVVTLLALTGNSGIELAKAEDPDVVLLDILMPGMDGYEVCRRLKAHPLLKDIPVVFITALKGDRESRIRALEAGAEAFLAKPVDPSELTAQIRAMVKIKAANIQKRDETARLAELVEERTHEVKAAHAAALKLLEDLKTENAARKKSENELFQIKETYFDIINSVTEAIYIQNAETGVFIDVNRGAEKMYGFTHDEIIGQTPHTMAASGLNDLDAIWKKSREVFLTGVPVKFDFWAVRKNGEIFPKEVIVNKGKYFGKEVLIATARDITEKKAVENDLQKSFNYSKAMLDANPDMMFVFDDQCNIVDFHAQSMDGVYVPPDVFIGKKPEEVLPPHVAVTTRAKVENVLKTGGNEYNTYNLEINGETRFFESRGVPFGNDKVLAFVRDITDLKLLENELKQSEEKLSRAQKLAKIGVWDWTIENDKVTWTEELYKIAGLNPDVSPPGFSEHHKLFSKASWPLLYESVQKILQTSDIFQLELEFVRADGEIRYVFAFGAPKFDSKNQIVGLYGTLQDITERKQAELALIESENRFREVIENSFDAAYRQDLNQNRLDYLSPNFFELTGYTVYEIKAMSIGEYMSHIHPGDISRVNEFFRESMKEGSTQRYVDYRFRHKNGEYRWFGDLSSVVRSAEGHPSYRYGSVQDISERKLAEESLKEHKEFLDHVLQTVPDPISVIRLSDNVCLQINKEYTKLMDWTPEEIIGNTYQDFNVWVNLEDRHKMINGVMNDGFIDSLEAKFRTKNGKIITGLISAKMITLKGVSCLVTITRDITERKKREEALLESQERARSQQATISQMIMDDAIISANVPKAFERFTETMCSTMNVERTSIWLLSDDEKQLICKTLYEAGKGEYGERQVINTEDYPIYFESVRMDNLISASDAMNDPRTFELAENYLKVSGITSMLDAGIQIEGHLVGIVCLEHVGEIRHWHPDEESFVSTIAAMIGQLISNDQRKQAEEKVNKVARHYQDLIEKAPDGIVLVGTDGNFKYVSPTALRIFGFDGPDIYDTRPDESTHPEDVGMVLSELGKLIADPSYIPTMKYRYKNKTGGWRWVESTCTNLYANPDVEAIVINFRDITDRMIAEQELRESEERFRALHNASFGGIAIHNSGIILECNLGLTEMTGYTHDELINMDGLNLIAPQCREQVLQNILSGYEKPYESIGLRKNSEMFPLRIEARNIPYKGKMVRVTEFRDITEQKNAETELREKQHFINSIAENSPNIIYVFDIALNRNVYTNRSVSEMLGYSQDEVSDNDPGFFDRLIYPEDLKQFDEFYKHIADWPEQKVFDYEYRILSKTNGWRWYKGSEKEFQRVDGKVVSMIGTVNDITAAKIAENSVTESEEKFRLLITQMEQGLALHEAIYNDHGKMVDYRFLDVNESFERLTGLRREDILGKNVLEVLPGTESYWFDKYGSVVETGKPLHFENFHQEIGKYYEVVAYRNREHQFAVIISDITRRKQSEIIQQIQYKIARNVLESKNLEQLSETIQSEISRILDTTNFLVGLYDDEEKYFKRVVYRDENDDFAGWKTENSLSGQVVKKAKTLLLNRSQIEELAAEENLNLLGTPAECWLGVPLMTHSKIYGALVIQSYTNQKAFDTSSAKLLEMVAHEISIFIERQRMIEDLKAAKAKAEENDRLKSAFLANMSHEIRTPMNGILGFTDLLKEPTMTFNEQQKYIDVIEKSGQRLLNLINDLIDISKIEAGQVKITLSEIDIMQEAQILHSFFLPETDKKSVQLALRFHSIPGYSRIVTDRDKFLSIFSNLIKNAVKFTDTGSIEFGFEREGSFVRFFVKDSGRGIPADKLNMIFDRFGQADVSLTRNYEGAGLGLSIAKAYVEMLGGTIGVTSKPGVGSEFYFTLPLPPDTSQQVTPILKVVESTGTKIPSRKLKVLVAEDDEFSIQYFSIKLRDIASELHFTNTGTDTIEFCRDNPDTDLVLMDIKMPGVDGLTASRKIREFNKSVIIVAQTAYALSGDREKALDAGCNDYLSKPIKKESLFQLVEKYFHDI